MNGWRRFEWLAPTLAVIGFLGAIAVFTVERGSFRKAVIGWAEHDLEERTELAARTLREMLETGDFAGLHAFGVACRKDGVRLVVTSEAGGLVFDSQQVDERSPESLAAWRPVGEWRVSLALPIERVLAPFNRAALGFLLAALIGGTGMFIVFLTTFRQRIRIKELSRLERFRREFIADFSHELKTPLTGILGAVDLLGDERALTPQATRLLGMVKAEACRLQELAEGILELSRLERESDILHREATSVVPLLEGAVSLLQSEAERKGVRLVVRDETDNAPARLDPQLVVRALGNLLANAVRHAEAPEVRLISSRNGSRLRFVVEDEGKGIPVEHRARIFERFARVESSRATPGTGLGLAIVRRIARLHDGEIGYEPLAPQGSRFIFEISA